VFFSTERSFNRTTNVSFSLSLLHRNQTFAIRTCPEDYNSFFPNSWPFVTTKAFFAPSVSVCLSIVRFSHSVGCIRLETSKETRRIGATNNRPQSTVHISVPLTHAFRINCATYTSGDGMTKWQALKKLN